jgi:hypothetical protein
MHCENLTIFCWVLALLSGEDELLPLAGEELDVLEERCATPGLEEEPPQPASSRATLASTTTPRFVLIMSWSPSPSGGGCWLSRGAGSHTAVRSTRRLHVDIMRETT